MRDVSSPFADDAFRSARHFAKHMLQGDRLTLQPIPDAIYTGDTGVLEASARGIGLAAVLFRSGCWQVELLVGMPHLAAPAHRHPNVHSADVLLNGSLSGHSGLRAFREQRGSLAANLQSIPAASWHSGQAGEQGLVYLSFQQWINGVEPSHIIFDWEPMP